MEENEERGRKEKMMDNLPEYTLEKLKNIRSNSVIY